MIRPFPFTGVIILCLAAVCIAQQPPDDRKAEDRAAELIRMGKTEADRINTQIQISERELAGAYAAYEIDTEKAAGLERKLLELRGQSLASQRKMQLELRKLMGKERFEAYIKTQQPAPAQDRPAAAPAADKPAPKIFSGPQVGEKLVAFKSRGVFDAQAGKEIDFVTEAAGRPLVLLFMHDANRPSIGMTRVLMNYVASRKKDGLQGAIIWLAEDATEAENRLKTMRHALPKETPLGLSVDGREGPGAYGLNRNVTLTILVAKDNKVTANYALIQPSLQADLPGILDQIVKVAGGTAPRLQDLPEMAAMNARQPQAGPDERLRSLIRPVIQLNATAEEVDKAAAAVVEHITGDEAARKEVGRISRTIVQSGKLSNYGTARAQEHLRKWAAEYGGLKTMEAKPETPVPPKTPDTPTSLKENPPKEKP